MNQITPVMRALPPLFYTLAVCFLCLVSASANAQEETDEEAREKSKPIVLELDYRSNACAAKMNIEYFQRGENARVNTSISNEDCASSSGEYTVQIRIRDAESQIQNFEITETWSRDDDATIESTMDYFIGDNVDLVRVRSRNLKCRCKDTAPSDTPAPEGN